MSKQRQETSSPNRAGRRSGRAARILGNGIITGAADDDPSAIGTYASAGAQFGLGILWIAPLLLPMMYVVVYISAKLGQVSGKGLFGVIRDRYPRMVLYPLVIGAFAGNVIEAAANLGGVGAALNLLVPLPITLFVVCVGAIIVSVQVFGSYFLLRRIFKWLALALFAYVAAAAMAKPDMMEVLHATIFPRVEFTTEFMSIVVACIGTSLSAYVYTWQSNQEVEDEIALGRKELFQRKGATDEELSDKRRDVLTGMVFANVILYSIILSTGVTLHPAGETHIETAAQAAAALEPFAGEGAKYLFALGVVGVGFLAIPVMTTGAAYDLLQAFGKKGSLHAKPTDAKLFYGVIAAVTLIAVMLNFLGFSPMRALVWSGVVQGFSVPPLLLMMLLMTGDRRVMGERRNGWLTGFLGWTTTAVTFLALLALALTWFL